MPLCCVLIRPSPSGCDVSPCAFTIAATQVTQSRQAVDVSSPVGLVKHLEALIGGIDYEEAIAQHSKDLEQLAAGMEDSKAEIDRSVAATWLHTHAM